MISKPKLYQPDIILYGGPASGKSTQAKLLVQKLKCSHMNMGQLLRDAIRDKIHNYQKIAKYMQTGKLVPEVMSVKLVKKFINQTNKKSRIVFDGYPRRMKQVRVLEPLLKKLGRESVMIFIDLPVGVARSRIQKRAKIENRIDDTNPKVINERIKIFQERFRDVMKYYRNKNALVKISGNQSREAIHKDILQAIKSL